VSRRVAFVTGASRGIGRAASLALAAAGFDVVVTARTVREGDVFDRSDTVKESDERALPGSIESTAEAVRALGREALPCRLDLLDRASIDAAVDEALATWGHVDLLLNNGIYQGPGTMDRVMELPLDRVEAVFRGNVIHQLHLIQRLLPGMLERKCGMIVNVVSGSALIDPKAPAGEGGWGYAYAASKAAFLRMAGVLHVEHRGGGVGFYNLDPGFVITEALVEKGLADQFRRFGGAPPEVPAAVIAWLATAPDTDDWKGKTLFAQEFCAEHGLLEGWPPKEN